MSLEQRMESVIVNCAKIKQMRNDRTSNIIELNDIYEQTVKTIIDITPDVSLNQWMDGRLGDQEVIAGLCVDRAYAEHFIENVINHKR